ncbi:glycosyltransferase family 2 protein [Verticiella sediminum]|nr:glycosyltransferase [Verticiella sediminum]
MAGIPDLLRRYHDARQAGDADVAAACLSLALQTPGYRDDARLCLALALLEGSQPQRAFLHLADALRHMRNAPPATCALPARAALDQHRANEADALLADALEHYPDDPTLRTWRWRALAATLPPETLAERMRAALPGIRQAAELRLVLRHLIPQAQAGEVAGAIAYDAAKGALRGWVVDLREPAQTVTLRLVAGQQEVALQARHAHPLLAAVGGPATHGGIVARITPYPGPVRLYGPDGRELPGSPLALVAPLPHLAAMDKAGAQPRRRGGGDAGSARPVDVLIPVYDGRDETLACIQSVLRAAKANRTPHRVIALNDASPDAGLSAALRELAQARRIDLVERPVNLGFIRNVNRGMLMHPAHDVVWLNADTRVNGNWLDRLRAAAYAARNTASATPFSNNGELLSFPRLREAAPMPGPAELAALDELAAARGNNPVEIETGCGFCLFIKRSALDEVGLLDETDLERGYGEETDWCLRARARGWKHVAATHVFVGHQGGVSFSDEKTALVKHNNDILRRRYPDAPARFDRYVRQDPLAPVRNALQRARLKPAAAWLKTRPRERTLWVQGPRAEQGAPDETLTLAYRMKSQGRIDATLRVAVPGLPITVNYALPDETSRLDEDLRRLGVQAIGLRHAAHCPAVLRELPTRLRIAPAERPAAWPAPVAADAHAPTTTALLIADDLSEAGVRRCWLSVARDLARQPAAERLYLLLPGEDAAWMREFLATGAVLRAPELGGLDSHQALALAGCTAAVSLNDAPDADWLAPWIASRAHLPLYAPASALALQAGARPLENLATAIPLPSACAA